jgi:hypothetical protein
VHGEDDWVPSRALYALLDGYGTRDMGLMDTVRSQPWPSRVVIHRQPNKGRKHRNLNGVPARTTSSRKVAARYREPWLLVASPALQLSARQLVRLYARRMQIEQSFRDLKSHHYGSAFEDSLTRIGKRLQVLLLVHAIANFASWLAGLACEATHIDSWLSPVATKRKLYSTMRIGREALVRCWPMERIDQWLERLHTLPPNVLAQTQATP